MNTLSDKLAAFRKTFPRKRIGQGGETWEYFAGGQGECIIFLHGGMATGEMYFEYLADLQDSYFVIAPCLPAGVHTVSGAVSGITAILEAEQQSTSHLLGHSQGGGWAITFADRLPQRVSKLMISSALLPSPAHADKVRKQMRVASPVPNFLLLPAFRIALRRAFQKSGTVLTPEQQSFLLNELTPLPKSAALRRYAGSQARLQLDYHLQTLTGNPPSYPTLLFETGRDGFVSQAEAAALRAHYPKARVCRFENAGHLDVIIRADQFISVIRSFLANDPAPAQRQ